MVQKKPRSEKGNHGVKCVKLFISKIVFENIIERKIQYPRLSRADNFKAETLYGYCNFCRNL